MEAAGNLRLFNYLYNSDRPGSFEVGPGFLPARSGGLLGVARRGAPSASDSEQPLADQSVPFQQLHEPRLGLLYRHFTILDHPL
jgi:hypothetical protein